MVCFSMTGTSTAQTSSSLFSEGFTGDTLGSPTGWLLSAGNLTYKPCLTARPSSAGALQLSNGTSIANCAELDPTGQGALRLTPAVDGQSGNMQYVTPLSTADGLDISFKIAIYDGSGADGIVFFLKDGANTNNAPGSAGAGLGYGYLRDNPSSRDGKGLPGGLIGIGFDLYGNFSSNLPSGRSCPNAPGNTPSSIAVRGADTSLNKDGSDGFCWIAATTTGVSYAGSDRTLAQRQVRILIDPAIFPDPKIRIYISPDANNVLPSTPNLVIPAPAAYLAVSTFKFGFAAGTGGQNNIHEVWDLGINPVAEPAARCAGNGFISSGRKMKDHFAFNVATTPEGTQEGNIVWSRDSNEYRFKGKLSRCITSADTNIAAGTGELVQRIGNDWVSLGEKNVSITFTPTEFIKKRTLKPGTVSFTFSDTSIVSSGSLGGGVIKLY